MPGPDPWRGPDGGDDQTDGTLVDPGAYAIPGDGIGYAFSALDGVAYCVLLIEPCARDPDPDADVRGILEARDTPGVHCMMTGDQPVDETQPDDMIAICREENDTDGVGDLVGGEPVLTDSQISVAGCRSDVSIVAAGDGQPVLDALPVLESGQTLAYGDFSCTVQQSGSLTCRRGDGRGWTVRDGGYAIG
ncbi:hypothetical protein [Brachybacterium huguangmaarense]